MTADGSLFVLASLVLKPHPDHSAAESGHFHQLVPGRWVWMRRHRVASAKNAKLVLG